MNIHTLLYIIHTHTHTHIYKMGFPDDSVNNLPAVQETWVQSQGWENALEEGMSTHSSILAWRTPMARGAWWTTDHEVAKSWTQLSD